MTAHSQRVQAAEQLVKWARGEHICQRCHGEGELRFNASQNLDPQHDDHVECPACGGTGEAT